MSGAAVTTKNSRGIGHEPSAPSTAPSGGRRFRAWDLAFAAVALAVLAAHLVDFFANMFNTPVGHDEAYNMQSPLNLVQGNGFASEDWLTGGSRLQFDAIVSTGPTVELPVALNFAIFGVSLEAARIVMLPFLLLLVVCLFVLGRRIGGRWAGIAAAALPLALNTRIDWPFTVIMGPSDVLGEYAAAAFIALGLVTLRRRSALSGVFLGLAVLAKFISFIAAAAFFIAILISPKRPERRWREAFAFAGTAVAPYLLWELVKLISLGAGGYIDSLRDQARFIFRSGSGIDGGGRTFFLERLARLFAGWWLPTPAAVVLGLVLIGFAAVGISLYLRRGLPLAGVKAGAGASAGAGVGVGAGVADQTLPPAATGFARVRTAIPVELWATAGTFAAFALWWSFVSTSIFIRHTMPVLLVAIPLLGALAVKGARSLMQPGRPVLASVGLIALVAGTGIGSFQASQTIGQSFHAIEWTKPQQLKAAAFVEGLGVDSVLGIGWWANPDIRFFSGVPSTPVGTGDGPLVLGPILARLDPALYARALAQCGDVLYDEDGWVVCDLPADADLAQLK